MVLFLLLKPSAYGWEAHFVIAASDRVMQTPEPGRLLSIQRWPCSKREIGKRRSTRVLVVAESLGTLSPLKISKEADVAIDFDVRSSNSPV